MWLLFACVRAGVCVGVCACVRVCVRVRVPAFACACLCVSWWWWWCYVHMNTKEGGGKHTLRGRLVAMASDAYSKSSGIEPHQRSMFFSSFILSFQVLLLPSYISSIFRVALLTAAVFFWVRSTSTSLPILIRYTHVGSLCSCIIGIICSMEELSAGF